MGQTSTAVVAAGSAAASVAPPEDVTTCRRCGCTADEGCAGGCDVATHEQLDAAGLGAAAGPLCTGCLPWSQPEVLRAITDLVDRDGGLPCPAAIRFLWVDSHKWVHLTFDHDALVDVDAWATWLGGEAARGATVHQRAAGRGGWQSYELTRDEFPPAGRPGRWLSPWPGWSRVEVWCMASAGLVSAGGA